MIGIKPEEAVEMGGGTRLNTDHRLEVRGMVRGKTLVDRDCHGNFTSILLNQGKRSNSRGCVWGDGLNEERQQIMRGVN